MAIDPTVAQRDEQLAVLVAELTDRVQRGEPVDLEVECGRHPRFAKDLRELWGIIMMAKAAGSSSASPVATQPRANEFPTDSFQLPARFGDYELRQELG